jgi:hypothetical protein
MANPTFKKTPSKIKKTHRKSRGLGRALRTVGWGVLVLILLLLVGVGIISQMDWNQYKPQLTALASEKLGVPVSIDGDLRLRLWPRIGVQVEGIRVANVPGGQAPNLLVIPSVSAQLEWSALLSKQLTFPELQLEQAQIVLEKLANGQGNWEVLRKVQPAAAPANQDAAPPANSDAAAPKLSVDLQNVRLKDASISYRNGDQQLTLSGINGLINGDAGALARADGAALKLVLTADRLEGQGWVPNAKDFSIQLSKLKAQVLAGNGRIVVDPFQAEFLGKKLTGVADLGYGALMPSDIVLNWQGGVAEAAAVAERFGYTGFSGGELNAKFHLQANYGLFQSDWRSHVAFDVEFGADQLQYQTAKAKFSFADLLLEVSDRYDFITLKQAKAEFLGGTVDLGGSRKGTGVIKGAADKGEIKAKLVGLSVDQIKQAFAPHWPLAGGKFDFDFNGKLVGDDAPSWQDVFSGKAVKGGGKFLLQDTAFQGYDGAKLLAAVSKVRTPQELLPIFADAAFKAGTTPIEKVAGDFTVEPSWMVRTDNSVANAPGVVAVQSAGYVDLAQKTLEVRNNLKLAVEEVPSFDVLAAGYLDAPRVTVNLDQLLRHYGQKYGVKLLQQVLPSLRQKPQKPQ